MSNSGEFFEQFKKDVEILKQQAPDVARGFGSLFMSVMKEGALTVRQKELIALGIGLAQQCEPCIRLHVQKAVSAGASREEVVEAAGVAVMMQGGPAYTHLPLVLETLNALSLHEGSRIHTTS